MTDKQRRIVKQVLVDHLNDLDDMIKEFDDDEHPETLKGFQEEKEACEEALKLVSKEIA